MVMQIKLIVVAVFVVVVVVVVESDVQFSVRCVLSLNEFSLIN